MAALSASSTDVPAPPHRVRTAALVNLAAVLERCDEQASHRRGCGLQYLCLPLPHLELLRSHPSNPPSCALIRPTRPSCAFIRPTHPSLVPQMLPAVYSFIGASWSASPTQLGYITLCRALVQALSSPIGGIAGAHARLLVVL